MDRHHHKGKVRASDDASETSASYHVPVLLSESVDALQVKEGGIYVDCTFGGGGHSAEILKRLGTSGRLIAFDQDPDSRSNLPDDDRIRFFPHNFRHLTRFLRLEKIKDVDGILADLGVSSHQFDSAPRGFSTRMEGSMDMRMDQRQHLTAFEVVRAYSEERLHKMFERYGEVTNAKSLARSIVQIRQQQSLETLSGFKHAIGPLVKGNPNRYFAQVFQALRIEVNDELGALEEMLAQVPGLLKQGGRLAIITFHSLEDRIVKQFYKNGRIEDEEEESDPFGREEIQKIFKIITRKPVVPSEAEIKKNPRARSAKLRVAEKN